MFSYLPEDFMIVFEDLFFPALPVSLSYFGPSAYLFWSLLFILGLLYVWQSFLCSHLSGKPASSLKALS